ncbi:MAG: hypothetical protein IPI20_14880 [Rhodoferax sp.]|nr:hypothetical protein [Rhodoferax sp.]
MAKEKALKEGEKRLSWWTCNKVKQGIYMPAAECPKLAHFEHSRRQMKFSGQLFTVLYGFGHRQTSVEYGFTPIKSRGVSSCSTTIPP